MIFPIASPHLSLCITKDESETPLDHFALLPAPPGGPGQTWSTPHVLGEWEQQKHMKDLPCSSNSSCVNNGVVPISKNLPHLHSSPSNPFSIQSQLKINIPTQACQQNIMTPSKHGIGVLVNGVLSQNSLNNSTKFKIAFSSQKKKRYVKPKLSELSPFKKSFKLSISY